MEIWRLRQDVDPESGQAETRMLIRRPGTVNPIYELPVSNEHVHGLLAFLAEAEPGTAGDQEPSAGVTPIGGKTRPYFGGPRVPEPENTVESLEQV